MQYITETLRKQMFDFGNKKIFITAPTGSGKSTFIKESLLPMVVAQGSLYRRKLLILCNRRSLKRKYQAELRKQFDSYDEYERSVEVRTYQETYELIKYKKTASGIFDSYQAIVCDEAHYFLADSDFNPGGTFGCLNALLHGALNKLIIFLTATMTEVKPLIQQTINVQAELLREHGTLDPRCIEIVDMDFSYIADFKRYKCFSVPDFETLSFYLSSNAGKSVIFIDDKQEATNLRDLFIKAGLDEKEIGVLNSETIDEKANQEISESLLFSQKMSVRVLITTSVLDNGIDIKDDTVKNICIVTESRISFLQMIGRVRCSDANQQLNLFFLERPHTVFRERQENWRLLLTEYKKAEGIRNAYPVILTMFEKRNSYSAANYSKIFVAAPEGVDYFPRKFRLSPKESPMEIMISNGDTCLFLNIFGKAKTGLLMMEEEKNYHEALKSPVNVIYRQMEWIHKAPSELTRLASSAGESFVKDALMIQAYNREQFIQAKKELFEQYKKLLFPEIKAKSVPSNEKFTDMLAKYALELIVEADKTRCNVYTVNRISAKADSLEEE